MKKIRFGIIGCGGIARRRTINGLLMAESAVCEAIMDTNRESLDATGDQYGIAKRYLDGKDFTTSYAAAMDAVNADKVRMLLSVLNDGSKVEYVVNDK